MFITPFMHSTGRSRLHLWMFLLIAGMSLAACSSPNELAYFADTKEIQEGSLALQKPEIKIEPNDELVINITSALPEQSVMYNLPVTNPGLSGELVQNSTTTRQQTYIVGQNGYITLPVIGRMHVAGMTTSQLADDITQRIENDVEKPYVRVTLVNFKVKVMGEVQNPGSYKFDNERATILDALAEAGDMTIFGRRDNVILWREEDGQVNYHRLNLQDSKIASSPYYYLKQNDVVYVEPSDVKKGQAEYNQNNSFKVSVVSAIVSGASVITSLIIAFAK